MNDQLFNTTNTNGFHQGIGKKSFCLVVILACLLVCNTTYGQTIWLGEISADWHDADNWSTGIPAAGNNASIPSDPPGTFLPFVNQALEIDFSIENANTITFQAPVNINSGTITNYESATMVFMAALQNYDSLDNDGNLILNGNFINHHNINNSGSIDMGDSGQLVNEVDANFENYGDIALNYISLNNLGQFSSFGGTIISNGYFQNFGDFFNNGTLLNQECGVIRNYNLFENQFIIQNENLIYNDGDFLGNPIQERTGVQNSAGLTHAIDECQGPEGWTHYSDPIDDKLILSIYTEGQDIGSVLDESLIIRLRNEATLNVGGSLNLGNAAYTDCDDWYVLNRFWFIKSTLLNTGPFKIRFYFNESNFTDIQRSQPLAQGIHELYAYHLTSTENGYDTEVGSTDAQLYKKGASSSLESWSLDEVSFGEYIELEVNQLNGAYGAGVKSWIGGTIPFQTDFKAKPNRSNRSIDLSWSTSREKDFGSYQVQRSFDGISFSNLNTIPAIGNSEVTNTYVSIDDLAPLDSTLHYRLVLTLLDGTTRLSPTRTISFSKNAVKIFPNPSDDELYLGLTDIESGIILVRIFDFNGTLKFNELVDVENYRTVENLYNRVNLGNGIYTLQIGEGSNSEVVRFLKMSQ